MDQKLNIEDIKKEYLLMAKFDLAMIFVLSLILWAVILNLYWLSYGLMFVLMICIFLRGNYLKGFMGANDK